MIRYLRLQGRMKEACRPELTNGSLKVLKIKKVRGVGRGESGVGSSWEAVKFHA